jgi:arylsulfatase A-like enzyme
MPEAAPRRVRPARRGGRCGAAAILALASLAALPACTPARPRNAVLIVLDTLRPDRLSAYGNPRPTSPEIDALAARGVRFETVVTNTPWTLPAMVGLMTGEYPSARTFHDRVQRSLVEKLRDAGWATAAFTEGGFVSERFGFDRGFELFREPEEAAPAFGSSDTIKSIDTTFSQAREWLSAHGRERPFFLLVHTYEVHVPYRRRTFTEGLERGRLAATYEAGYALEANKGETAFSEAELAYIRALYDGGVAEADRQVGRLLETLAGLDLARDTVVAVTSDHGEDLGDRKPMRPGNHGAALYDEQMLVPLILYDPTRRYPAQKVAAQVRLVDVLVTICDLLGLAPEADRHGRSLVPLMTGEETEDRVAWLDIPRYDLLGSPAHSGLRTGRFKVIVNPPFAAAGRVELYDLAQDRGERKNVVAQDPRRNAELKREFDRIRAELKRLGPANFQDASGASDPVLHERLRSLGYVE